jgi:HSP20 family protein
MNTNNGLSIWNAGLGPLGELRREMDRFFDDFWTASPTLRNLQHADATWAPACDVEEGEDHYLLTLDMPGVPKDKIKLEIVDGHVTISGERHQEQKGRANGAWYSERRQGKFQRSFALPVGVDADKVEANYQDGTLRVYVPKAESAKPRQIKITNGTHSSFFGKLIGQSSAKETEAKAS